MRRIRPPIRSASWAVIRNPGQGRIDNDHYLPATPDNSLWGWWHAKAQQRATQPTYLYSALTMRYLSPLGSSHGSRRLCRTLALAGLAVLAVSSCGARDGNSAPSGVQSAGGDEAAQPRPAASHDTATGPVDPGPEAEEGRDPDEPDPGARQVLDPAAQGAVSDTAPEAAVQLEMPGPALRLDGSGPVQLNELAQDQDPPKLPEGTDFAADNGQDSTGSPDGVLYTYHDGDAERRVWLVPGIRTPVQDSVGDAGAEGQTGSQGDLAANSQSAGDALVFVSESGTEMTLPGGVALVLDPGLSGEEVDQFLTGNGISPSRVSDLVWIDNGFLVEAEPGLASLELANALAPQEGVVISSPNWSSVLVPN